MAPPVAGYIDWWDATNAAQLTLTGSRVDLWGSTGSKATTLSLFFGTGVNSGTRTLNGLNVIDFDGASGLRETSYSQAQPMTAFFVMVADSGNTGHLMDGDAARMLTGFSGTQYQAYAGTVGNHGTQDTSPHVRAVTFNGASSTEHVDGVSSFSGGLGAQGLTGIRVGIGNGDANRFNGAIGEIILYGSALSAGDRQSTEAYLTARWFATSFTGYTRPQQAVYRM